MRRARHGGRLHKPDRHDLGPASRPQAVPIVTQPTGPPRALGRALYCTVDTHLVVCRTAQARADQDWFPACSALNGLGGASWPGYYYHHYFYSY